MKMIQIDLEALLDDIAALKILRHPIHDYMDWRYTHDAAIDEALTRVTEHCRAKEKPPRKEAA